jgi:hypothetical protein
MKKHIREMIDDLRKKHDKDYVPPVPNSPTTASTVDLNPPAEPALPSDLENQILSQNSLERLEQFDFQAQQESILETDS